MHRHTRAERCGRGRDSATLWPLILLSVILSILLLVIPPREKSDDLVQDVLPQIALSERAKICDEKSLLDISKCPPSAGTLVQETVRLNEVLAHLMYTCSQKFSPMHMHDDQFPICEDIFQVQSSTLLSITYPNTPLNYEKAVGKSAKSVVVLASGGVTQDLKGVKILARSLPFEQRVNSLSLAEMRDIFADVSSPLILKWDISNSADVLLAPESLLQTLSLLEVDLKLKLMQLHVTVRIPDLEGHRTLLHKWYLLVNSLFYHYRLALYNAGQDGSCGRSVMNCKYFISFQKIPFGGTTDVKAPVAGLGSPTEEHRRVHDFLNGFSNLHNISTMRPVLDFWAESAACVHRIPEGVRYLFSHSEPVSRTIDAVVQKACTIRLFYTDLSEETKSKLTASGTSIKIGSAIGVSPTFVNQTVPGAEPATQWTLVPLTDTLKDENITSLILNLDGSEWDVMTYLLESGVLQRIKQLAIVTRLWYGEENENYHKFYSWLLRFEMTGLTRVHTERLPSGLPHCPHEGCYLVIYARSNMDTHL